MPTPSATSSPVCGANEVDRKVTSAGPVTKTTSSATPSKAKAVCRSRGSVSRCAQRARTIAPTCGMAVPAAAAARCGHGRAQSRSTAVSITVVAATKATVSAYSTRVWPKRSASRPWRTANAAFPTTYAAETWPASA